MEYLKIFFGGDRSLMHSERNWVISSAWFLASLLFSIPKPRLALRCKPREAPPLGALPSARRLQLYSDTMSSPRNTSPPWTCQVLCSRILKNKSLSWHLEPHPAPRASNFSLNLSLEPETLPSTDIPLCLQTRLNFWATPILPAACWAAAAAKSLQFCPTLCNPIDGSPPGSPSLGFSRQEHWSGLPFPSPVHESEKWKWSRSVVSNS